MMVDSNIAEFETKLREICIRENWLPPQEDVEALKNDTLDEIDSFWVGNYFSVKTECYYKSKFVAVSFLHKPYYPHNCDFTSVSETYVGAFNDCLAKIENHIKEGK